MAKFIGNHAKHVSDITPDPVYNMHSHYERNLFNKKYFGIIAGNAVDQPYGSIEVVEMSPNGTIDRIANQKKNRLIRLTVEEAVTAVQDIRFSDDMEYGIFLNVGITGTDFDHGIRFLKRLEDSDGTTYYTELTAPVGSLSLIDFCDISPDGTFAVGRSGTTPYLEFYSRSGDTWSVLNAVSGSSITSPVVEGRPKIFHADNTAYVANNLNTTTPLFTALRYDSGANSFVVQSTTGITPNTRSTGLGFVDNTFFVSVIGANPYIRCFSSSNGFDFTEGTVTGTPAVPHYAPVVSPCGRYVFITGNSNTYPYIVYKRNGNDLEYLTDAFDVLPSTSSYTRVFGISWTPDSRYVFIAAASGSPLVEYYGCRVYERKGDNFYLITTPSGYLNNGVPLLGDITFNQGGQSIYNLTWFKEGWKP